MEAVCAKGLRGAEPLGGPSFLMCAFVVGAMFVLAFIIMLCDSTDMAQITTDMRHGYAKCRLKST